MSTRVNPLPYIILTLLTLTLASPVSELSAQPSISILSVKAPSVFPYNQPFPVYIRLKNNNSTSVTVLIVLQLSAYLGPYWCTSCYVYIPALSTRSITLTVPYLAIGPNNLTVSVYYKSTLLNSTTLEVVGGCCPCYPPCTSCYPPCCPPCCYPSYYPPCYPPYYPYPECYYYCYYWCCPPGWYVRYPVDPSSEEPSPTPSESERPPAELKAYLTTVIAPTEVEVGEVFTVDVAVKVEGNLTGSLEIRAIGEHFEFTPTLAEVAVSGQTGRARVYGKALSEEAYLLAVYLLHNKKPVDVQLIAVRAKAQEPPQQPAQLAEAEPAEAAPTEATPTEAEAPAAQELKQPEPQASEEAAEESGLMASRVSYTLKYSAEGFPMLVLLIENTGSQPHTYVLECMSQFQQAVVQPGMSRTITLLLPREGGVWKLTVDGELYAQGEVPELPPSVQLTQSTQLSSAPGVEGVYRLATVAAVLLSTSLVALALALRRPAPSSH